MKANKVGDAVGGSGQRGGKGETPTIMSTFKFF